MPSKTEDTAVAGPAPVDRSIGTAINVATRSVHTKLNKLIIMRLRLALPPQADDASNYVQGLLHITPIYSTFESLWQAILDADPVDTPRGEPPSPPPSPSAAGKKSLSDKPSEDKDKDKDKDKDTSEDSDSDSPPTACSRIHLLLFQLRSDKMLRASALRQDLSALTGWSDAVLAEQLDEIATAGESPLLTEFVAHIRKAVTARPHVLLAYAWVLYMALFSGGRFIRASLERVDAGSPFWTPLAATTYTGGGSSSSGEEEEQPVESDVDAAAAKATGLGVAMLGPWLANQVGLGGIGMGASAGKDKDKGKEQAQAARARNQPQHHHHQPNHHDQLQNGDVNQPLPQQQQQQQQQREHPLAFFRFATPSDGEDLKQTFKARLAEATSDTSAGNLLSTKEREDIVQEAQLIFEYMIRAVAELDEVCGTEEETRGVRTLSLRSRDSVVVEKEKRRRLAALVASTPAARGEGETTGREGGKEVRGENGGKSSGKSNSKGAMRFT
ncbi:hypothetical protein GGR53DRAFT_526729 [Hypoxylon sp. FL1150]|nr:hypothetical protein GGR53DRAFT_526729 [Hypoxylon sp. FL1150]